MQSFLLVTSDFPKPFQTQLNTPDFLFIDDQPSITIKTIRSLKTWVSTKPFQADHKTVLIHRAHTMTLPAQNALLKTLEEPPPQVLIYLTCPNPHLLLPTIVSRCQIISSTSSTPAAPTLDISFASLSPGERLVRVGEYTTNRQVAIDFCQQLLSSYRSQLHSGNLRVPLKPVAHALTLLQRNINPKLVLEHLALTLPA